MQQTLSLTAAYKKVTPYEVAIASLLFNKFLAFSRFTLGAHSSLNIHLIFQTLQFVPAKRGRPT